MIGIDDIKNASDTNTMTSNKLNRIRKASKTARFPRTFTARIDAIPAELAESMTAKQLAAMIDGPMQVSYQAGRAAGYKDAQ